MKKHRLLLLGIILLLLCGCANTQNNLREIRSYDDLNGATFAQTVGSFQIDMVNDLFPDSSIEYIALSTERCLAIQSGKVDATIVTDLEFLNLSKIYPDLMAIDIGINPSGTFFATTKEEENKQLKEDMASYLNRKLEDGSLEELSKRWHEDNENQPTFDFGELENINGVIDFAAEPAAEPYLCIGKGGYRGIEAEIVYGFAKEYGYAINFSSPDFASTLVGLKTGKYDLTCFLGYTDERAEAIEYIAPYEFPQEIAVVRNPDYLKTGGNSFIDSIINGFNNNFIKEDRYKLMISGFKVTVEIALLSAFFGTLFGIILCFLRRSKHSLISTIASIYIRFMQGVPIAVMLLVLYYIVFAKSSIGATYIGVLGFSLDFSVYVAEILRSGIEAVNVSQWEAALALGFNLKETYLKVIMPQALNHALPVYKGQFISMVKMTSVVGYIAVQDLTKISDIIRSKTFDPFFPLITTAIIYFLLAWVLTLLISGIEFKTNPLHRKNILKGIDVNKHSEIKEENSEERKEEVIIELKHLRKEYELATPLMDVNAKIKRGDVIAVIGPSGTGKSTLLRCINRMEEPSAGEVFVYGKEIPSKGKELCKTREAIGMVFQSFNLFEHLTVIENIMLAPTILKGTSRQLAYEEGIGLLKTVGLAEKALSYPNELSGGQKQRVAIVRALAMHPDVLLFDEPTSALDPTMVNEVLHVISDLAKKGMTMLIVTHEMKFAKNVSNRVFYMDEGEIYEDGSSMQVFENPRREKTRAFIYHLSLFNFTVENPNYDFLNLRTEFEQFAYSHLMNKKLADSAILAIEEILMQGAVKLDNIYPISVNGEYSQEGELRVEIGYKSDNINVLNSLDELSLSLINSVSKDLKHTYKDGKNHIEFLVLQK